MIIEIADFTEARFGLFLIGLTLLAVGLLMVAFS